MIEVLNRYIHDLDVCSIEIWDSEIEYDVKELSEF